MIFLFAVCLVKGVFAGDVPPRACSLALDVYALTVDIDAFVALADGAA